MLQKKTFFYEKIGDRFFKRLSAQLKENKSQAMFTLPFTYSGRKILKCEKKL